MQAALIPAPPDNEPVSQLRNALSIELRLLPVDASAVNTFLHPYLYVHLAGTRRLNVHFGVADLW